MQPGPVQFRTHELLAGVITRGRETGVVEHHAHDGHPICVRHLVFWVLERRSANHCDLTLFFYCKGAEFSQGRRSLGCHIDMTEFQNILVRLLFRTKLSNTGMYCAFYPALVYGTCAKIA